eukprot:SAG11_NODE_2258_length_3613_cov_1.480364_2_plen_59_part_00
MVGGAARDKFEQVRRDAEMGGVPAFWVAGELTEQELQQWDGRGTAEALVSAARASAKL